MGFQLEGLEDFRKAFQRVRDEGARTVDDTLRAHMEEDVFPATQARVPRMTGRLAATGRVEPSEDAHGVSVWYGDSATEDDEAVDYAAAVHQIEGKRHNPMPGVNFVKDPLEDSVPRLEERMAKALEDLARG